MEKILSFCFSQLSVEDKVLLRRIIRAQRAQTLNDILGRAQSPEVTEKLGERAPVVRQFLGEMVFLFKQDPDLFWQILDRWPTQFCLSRLLLDPDGPDDPEHLDQIASNLSAILLFQRLLGNTPIEAPATYVTQIDEYGRVPGLLQDISLELQNECFRKKRIEWICSPNEVSVRLKSKEEPEFTVPLPVQDNPFVKFVPLANAQTISFPILKETTIFGKPVTRFIGAYKDTDNGESNWNPLTLKESLTRAQEMIKDLWPEALDWAQTLIPAFVDMGVPPTRIRFSSSYEPGSPIFMSRVDNHFIHAEDVVHEIQHHRLYLFAGTPHFKSWRDLRQLYVSPYRPDPRHLRGVIVGMHAFLTVNELKKRRIVDGKYLSDALVNEMAEIHYKNLFAFRTILEHEEFGEFGRELFKQMARTIAEHHSLIKSLITPDTEKSFATQIGNHMEMVQREAAEIKTEIRNDAPLYRNWDETAQLAANYA